MTYLLGLILLSFFITSIFMVPFIDFLFYLKKRFKKRIFEKRTSETPIHDKLMEEDENTPSGGGILLIIIIIILTVIYSFLIPFGEKNSLKILLITLFSFGALGFIDDIRLIFTRRKGKFLGLGRRKLLIAQLIIATLISTMLYYIGFNNVYVPILGNETLDFWYIPVAALIIVAFANAVNISDGLDGLSSGLLLICLLAFLSLTAYTLNLSLAAFIGIWIGVLISFLYFNIWPARIFLGDAGAFGFGATLAVVGLLTAKILAVAIIGGMFVIIVFSSLLQITTKKFFNKKILPIAPIHMYFKYIGWPEAKIVTRFWLVQSLFAIFGLWIAFLTG